MSKNRPRARAFAAPFLLGLLALVATACPTQPSGPPYYGIIFNAPSVGYIGKTYTPTARATSGLPVSFALDASSTGCSFTDGVITYEAEGSCVINANQPGDETHEPSAQVQRTIGVHTCPPLRSGTWTGVASVITGPIHFSADVMVYGTTFVGTIDLSQINGPANAAFQGTVDCDVASMNANGTPLSGRLSWDGKKLSSSYQGIAIVLTAPPDAPE